MEKKIKVKKESPSLKISKKTYEMLVTLQILYKIRAKKKISLSKILYDVLTREIEKMEEMRNEEKKKEGDKNV